MQEAAVEVVEIAHQQGLQVSVELLRICDLRRIIPRESQTCVGNELVDVVDVVLGLQPVEVVDEEHEFIDIELRKLLAHLTRFDGIDLVVQRPLVREDEDLLSVEHGEHVVAAKQNVLHGLEGNVALAICFDEVYAVLGHVEFGDVALAIVGLTAVLQQAVAAEAVLANRHQA